MSAIRRLLERAQPGTRGGVRQHVARGEAIAAAIEARWGIQRPGQWRAKHLRWVLESSTELRGLSPATRYAYYRSARALAAALGHWPDWEPHLRGPWTDPHGEPARGRGKGGRPAKLAHRRGRGRRAG